MKALNNHKWLKILLKIFAGILVFALMLIVGCYGLGKIILNAKHCEAFMIDNTEVHTHINIPKKETIDCNYNPKFKLKRVYFVIKMAEEPMPEYISLSEFKYLPQLDSLNTSDFFRYNKDTLLQQANKKSLFYKEHTYSDGEYYKALLDTSTGQVWINIRFPD